MEAANKHVGRKPLANIEYSLVGATAEKHALSVLLNKKILLVEKILAAQNAVFYAFLPCRVGFICTLSLVAGEKSYSIADLKHLINENDALTFRKAWVKPDVFKRSVIMLSKSAPIYIYGRFLVYFQKLAKTAAVVIMPVGYHSDIRRRNIHAELLGIARKKLACAHIKENIFFFRFYKKRKSVFESNSFSARCIFT